MADHPNHPFSLLPGLKSGNKMADHVVCDYIPFSSHHQHVNCPAGDHGNRYSYGYDTAADDVFDYSKQAARRRAQPRPLPKRGQVKATIAALWIHAFAALCHRWLASAF